MARRRRANGAAARGRGSAAGRAGRGAAALAGGADAAAGLMRQAELARRHAYAPYSGFPVGAALLTRSGVAFLGCNVENASYGLTICAERSALVHAVSAGQRDLVALAVAGPKGRAAAPCGACRQVLMEFAPRLLVIWRGAGGRLRRSRLDALLPEAFGLERRGESRRRAGSGAPPQRRAARRGARR